MISRIKGIISRRIKRFFLSFVSEQIQNQSKNITLCLQERALNETVDYIKEKMLDIQSVSTKDEVLKIAAKKCKKEGLILEFGVFSGYTINLISDIFKSSTVYGFDSFEGLPENWRDGFPEGTFELANLPKVNSNVQLVKGWFNESLIVFCKNETADVAFLHIDCDLYSSTKTIFDNLKNRINKGTIIVFDEYFNYSDWENGEFKAFQEFVVEKRLKYRYITYNNQHEQVAVIIE